LKEEQVEELFNAIDEDTTLETGTRRRLSKRRHGRGRKARLHARMKRRKNSTGLSASAEEELENDEVVNHLMQKYGKRGLRAAGPDCEVVAFQSIPPGVYQCGSNISWNLESTCCEGSCGETSTCAHDPENQVFPVDEDDVNTVVFIADTGCNSLHDIF